MALSMTLSMRSYAPDDPLERLHVQIVHERLVACFQPVEDIARDAAQLRVAPFWQPLAQHLREIGRGPVKGARISRNQWQSACNERTASTIWTIDSINEGGNQHAMREAISMQ